MLGDGMIDDIPSPNRVSTCKLVRAALVTDQDVPAGGRAIHSDEQAAEWPRAHQRLSLPVDVHELVARIEIKPRRPVRRRGLAVGKNDPNRPIRQERARIRGPIRHEILIPGGEGRCDRTQTPGSVVYPCSYPRSIPARWEP
jgi:hypothetical protein